VSWPTRTELRASTIVVIVMTLIMAAIVWVFDKVYVFGLERLFRAG
jgi:preprotein translocase SecE subunit